MILVVKVFHILFYRVIHTRVIPYNGTKEKENLLKIKKIRTNYNVILNAHVRGLTKIFPVDVYENVTFQ